MAMPSEEVQDIVYAMQRENERIQSARTHSEMSEEKADDYFAVNRFFLINSFFRINQAFCVCFTCNQWRIQKILVGGGFEAKTSKIRMSSPKLRLIFRPKSEIQTFFSPIIRWSPKKKKKRS